MQKCKNHYKFLIKCGTKNTKYRNTKINIVIRILQLIFILHNLIVNCEL